MNIENDINQNDFHRHYCYSSDRPNPGLNLSMNRLNIRQFLENMRNPLNIWITMLSYEKCHEKKK